MQEHGSFEMYLLGQVISVNVFGGWNYETTARWCAEYRKHIDCIKTAPWARIMDLTHWELTTSDVWKVVDEANTWANLNNQKYDVVICSLSLQKKIVGRAHQALPNVEIKFCENMQDGKEWLELKGIINKGNVTNS